MERKNGMVNFSPEFQEYGTVRRWMEDGQDLSRLLLAERTAARTYTRLARQMNGEAGRRLEKMSREADAHAACLEGICLLVTGQVPEACPPPEQGGAPQSVLRRCYGSAMRTLVTYEARRDDPEYGPVFRRLAEQQQTHCKTILELIGRMTEDHWAFSTGR